MQCDVCRRWWKCYADRHGYIFFADHEEPEDLVEASFKAAEITALRPYSSETEKDGGDREMQELNKDVQLALLCAICTHANKQASKQANKQANKHTRNQTKDQPIKQANTHTESKSIDTNPDTHPPRHLSTYQPIHQPTHQPTNQPNTTLTLTLTLTVTQ